MGAMARPSPDAVCQSPSAPVHRSPSHRCRVGLRVALSSVPGSFLALSDKTDPFEVNSVQTFSTESLDVCNGNAPWWIYTPFVLRELKTKTIPGPAKRAIALRCACCNAEHGVRQRHSGLA